MQTYFVPLPLSCVKKKKRNIEDNNILKKNFENLCHSDLEHLCNYQVTVGDLNAMSKKHNIKLKGKKDEKLNQCYNILFLKLCVNRIVKSWKSYVFHKMCELQGPAKYNRNICNNEEDFLTMEKMEDIESIYFFSFRDEDNFVYGFNLKSIKQMIDKNQTFNPYNRKPLHKSILQKIYDRIKFNKLAHYDVDVKVEEDYNSIVDDIQTRIRNDVLRVFQIIDSFGYNTNIEWFMNLSRHNIIKFIRELYDIWNYRAGLSTLQRETIYPYGNPFHNVNVHILTSPTIPLITLKTMALQIMKNYLINHTNMTTSNKNICSMYILTALTLVSSEAAESFPWLYYSVSN